MGPMLQKQGHKTMTPRIGLDYMPSHPVKISRQSKEKWPFRKHDIAEEAGNGKGDNAMSSPKLSAFYRLWPSTPH